MPRFRLRFVVQEFDISGPEILIGRSTDCHVTIEDPLISRQHARIVIRGEVAFVSDAGSRNGVRVNGRLVKGEHELHDGDRLRLGTQEVLFIVVQERKRPARPTGHMRLCHACGTPYPYGAASCSNCGAPTMLEEETMSGVVVESKRSWTFHLLRDVIERALGAGRAVEAERLMRRAAKEIDERLAQGDALEPDRIEVIASAAVRLARLTGSSDWLAWVFTLYRRHGSMLADEVIERIEELDAQAFPDLLPLLDGYLGWYRAQQSQGGRRTTAELGRLLRLERYRGS